MLEKFSYLLIYSWMPYRQYGLLIPAIKRERLVLI